MGKSDTDTDVLIVGAGPVGLFLACECARRGMRWRIIEARAGQSEYSKALAVMPRTLEIFDMAGIAGPFLKVANRVTQVALVSRGRRLAQIPFVPENTPYPFVAMVPQDQTERLLARELQSKGGGVDYETKFVSSFQSADRVAVQLDRKGQPMDLTSRFLVGCDGAHSEVRHSLGLSFHGAAYEGSFMLADIETDEAWPGDEMQLCPSELGPLAIFPMSATRRRMIASVSQTEGTAPSLEVVKKALSSRGLGSLEVRGLRWSSYFRIQHRQVEEMRVARIFVAGDAAHIHSPLGGQGMNTGLHDAWNLAWKLDLALRNRGGENLLNSYSAERGPVVGRVIAVTDLLTRVMSTSNRFARWLRDMMIPVVSRLPRFQHTFVQRLSQLDVMYEGSPIIEGKGERYFDDSLRGGTGIGSRFVLLVGSSVDTAVAEALKDLCAAFADLVELRAAGGPGIVLVRPDGYVACRSPASADPSVIPRLRSLLERQTS